jgi:hypothetical protein
MAAAVVSGAVSVLLDRQPRLFPLALGGLLQYSAEYSTEGLLVSGTGRLNLLGALARPGSQVGIFSEVMPSRLLSVARAAIFDANVETLWTNAILWGNAENILWGNAENILWGNAENILWGNAENILWGNAENILWGNTENILWGSAENILWGNAENILWGSQTLTGE